MTLNKIKTTATANLVSAADKLTDDNLAERNSIIYELVCRTYVPFTGTSFDELLLTYGYQIPKKEQEKGKVKSKTLFK